MDAGSGEPMRRVSLLQRYISYPELEQVTSHASRYFTSIDFGHLMMYQYHDDMILESCENPQPLWIRIIWAHNGETWEYERSTGLGCDLPQR